MTSPDPAASAPPRPTPGDGARISPAQRGLLAVSAVLAWAGVVLRIGHDWFIHPAPGAVEHGLFGPYRAGVVGSLQLLADNLSYFTYWSNIALALVVTSLAWHPGVRSAWRRSARNTATLMIVLTGVLYVTLIAPTDVVTGPFNVLINTLVHYVTPALALVVWLVVGPRGWYTWRESLRVYVVPVAYLAYTLARGALTHTYPYDFFDVVRYGYASVLITMAVILVGAYAVSALFVVLDRVLSRRRPAPR